MVNLGDRYNTGKPELSYILDNPNAINGLAHHFSLGTRKYSRNNYKKGLTQVGVINSLLRHIRDFNNKIDFGVDEETGEQFNTVDAILWNALILSEQFYTRTDMDDRADTPVPEPMCHNSGKYKGPITWEGKLEDA